MKCVKENKFTFQRKKFRALLAFGEQVAVEYLHSILTEFPELRLETTKNDNNQMTVHETISKMEEDSNLSFRQLTIDEDCCFNNSKDDTYDEIKMSTKNKLRLDSEDEDDQLKFSSNF